MIRTKSDNHNFKIYKCETKAKSANKRFNDSISPWDVLDVLIKYNYKCFYCSDSIIPSKWQLDHFYPLANGGKNDFNNLVCTCKWCNTMKNALDGFAFINKCKNISENNWFNKMNINIITFNKLNKGYMLKNYKKSKKKLKALNFLNEEQFNIIDNLLMIASGRD